MRVLPWVTTTLFSAALGVGMVADPVASWSTGVRAIEPGQRVRIKTSVIKSHFYGERNEQSDWIVGTIVTMDDQFILLQPADTPPDSLSIQRLSIARIERSAGMDNRRIEGFWIGLFGGAAAGVVAAVLIGSNSISDVGDFAQTLTDQLTALVSFTVGGATAGYVVGHEIETERWEVSWERRRELSFRLHAHPRDNRIAASVCLDF